MTLEERTISFIATTLKKDPQVVGLDVKIEDLAEDSIELFGLISSFEKEFQLEASYEDLLDIETVGDIVAYLRQKGVE